MPANKPRKGKVKQSITIDKETWDKAGEILLDVGISRSRFIEITFRNLYRSKEETFEKVTTDLFGSLFDASSKIAKKKKK